MAMRMYSLEHLQHIWEPARDSRVALAWSRTTVMLAFRGTASLKNAETDVKVPCAAHLACFEAHASNCQTQWQPSTVLIHTYDVHLRPCRVVSLLV